MQFFMQTTKVRLKHNTYLHFKNKPLFTPHKHDFNVYKL